MSTNLPKNVKPVWITQFMPLNKALVWKILTIFVAWSGLVHKVGKSASMKDVLTAVSELDAGSGLYVLKANASRAHIDLKIKNYHK